MMIFSVRDFKRFFVLALAGASVLPSFKGIPNGLVSIQNDISLEGNNNEKSKSFKNKDLAPLFPSEEANGNYIVVLKENIPKDDLSSHISWVSDRLTDFSDVGGASFSVIQWVLPGYIGCFSPQVLKQIQRSPLVKYIEEDSKMDLLDVETQQNATWGLSRLSQRMGGKNFNKYVHDSEGGEGVTAYIIDSGVKPDSEFGGRLTYGASFQFPYLHEDFNGHGTHVAGIIGSKTWGVAKKTNLTSVSVANFNPLLSVSTMIKALDYVVDDHQKQLKLAPKGFKGSVVNFSIGGPLSKALDDAINASTDAGLHVVVGAGNGDDDACGHSPSRAFKPIKVGAITPNDKRAPFSSYGECVDIWAPGVEIESVGLLFSPFKMSGTSMAAPHVTGLVSYFLSLQPGRSSEFFTESVKPAEMKKRLVAFATEGLIEDLPEGSNNLLSFNGADSPLEFWH